MYAYSAQPYDVDNRTWPCGILHTTHKNPSWEIYSIQAWECGHTGLYFNAAMFITVFHFRANCITR